jgi:hypothetical protein
MTHYVLNDSATDFIHRLALKTKHWLLGTVHSCPEFKNSICAVQYVSQSHSQHLVIPRILNKLQMCA